MIRLSRKFIKRSIVGLALLAPIVYLFGTQFAALAGAHGEEVFAEPVYIQEYIPSDSSYAGGSFRLDIDDPQTWKTFLRGQTFYTFDFSYLSNDYTAIYAGVSSNNVFFYVDVNDSSSRVEIIVGGSSAPIPISIYFDGVLPSNLLNDGSSLYVLSSVPSSVVVENNSAYTQYLFSNMFGKSNFLTDWGSDAVSDNPHGFAPFGVLLKTIDENVLHLSDLQIGLMCYGYFYYCAHVLIFAFVFECATFFISWCSSIFNKFGGKDNGD